MTRPVLQKWYATDHPPKSLFLAVSNLLLRKHTTYIIGTATALPNRRRSLLSVRSRPLYHTAPLRLVKYNFFLCTAGRPGNPILPSPSVTLTTSMWTKGYRSFCWSRLRPCLEGRRRLHRRSDRQTCVRDVLGHPDGIDTADAVPLQNTREPRPEVDGAPQSWVGSAPQSIGAGSETVRACPMFAGHSRRLARRQRRIAAMPCFAFSALRARPGRTEASSPARALRSPGRSSWPAAGSGRRR